MIDWDKLEKVFDYINTDVMKNFTNYQERFEKDDIWPDRAEQVHAHISGELGYDESRMAGPHDWYLEGADKKTGILDRTSMLHDNILRRKIYIGIPHYYEKGFDNIPELRYFFDLGYQYQEEMESYIPYFKNQDDIEKISLLLMLIEYSNENIPEGKTEEEYWKWNFEKFGTPHCDDTLGGLHLGENIPAFYIDKDAKRVYHDLTDGNTLWFWGQYSEASGQEPTIHGVEYLNNSNGKKRYSVIFNLQAEYKGKE